MPKQRVMRDADEVLVRIGDRVSFGTFGGSAKIFFGYVYGFTVEQFKVIYIGDHRGKRNQVLTTIKRPEFLLRTVKQIPIPKSFQRTFLEAFGGVDEILSTGNLEPFNHVNLLAIGEELIAISLREYGS